MMVFLHKTAAQYFCKTFGELANAIQQEIITHFSHADTVICVFDHYDHPNDVKAYERRRHGTGQRAYKVFENNQIPNWSSFLLVDDNKIELSLFLSEVFERNAQKSISNNQRLILTGGYKNSTTTKIIEKDLISEPIHFRSNHLEADCRMIFMAHIMHSE